MGLNPLFGDLYGLRESSFIALFLNRRKLKIGQADTDMNLFSRRFKGLFTQKRDKLLSRVLSAFFVGLWVFEVGNHFRIFTYHVDYTWLGLVISTTVVFVTLKALDYFFVEKLHGFLPMRVWLCGIILVIGDFSGDFFGLYKGWERYDQLMHFMSGPLLVGALIVVFETISRLQAWRHPAYVPFLLALGTSTIGAVLYEAEEYIEDILFLSNRLGDGPDTANDLLLNFLGGVGVILVTVLYRRYVYRPRSATKTMSMHLRSVFFALKRG